MTDNNPMLMEHLTALDAVIAGVAGLGLRETVALLKIARLDLAMQANSIAEAEFGAVLDTVKRNLAAPGRRARRPSNKGQIQIPRASRGCPRPNRRPLGG